jgi:hypothetical protein
LCPSRPESNNKWIVKNGRKSISRAELPNRKKYSNLFKIETDIRENKEIDESEINKLPPNYIITMTCKAEE